MNTNRQFSNSIVFLAALVTVASVFSLVGHAQGVSPEKERELIAILGSTAPAADKALACKHLAVDGSGAAVPELAKLLADERLASWARIALEVIPGSAADEALRKAADSLKGNLLVGAINSIGVRRDSGAVDQLIGRLQDPDTETVAAAAVALGRIGNSAAAQALRQNLASAPALVRSAVAEGCVLCAERFFASGNLAEAVAIYDQVRKAEVPRQRIVEATRGAILARGQDGIPLLLEQLSAPDKGLFQIALSTAREFPGREIDKALAAAIENVPADRAALVIFAMADRKETVELAAILKAAGNGSNLIRLAAIGALGRVGDASCLAPLLEIALDPDADLSQSAKAALAELPDESVDKVIVARLANAQGKMQTLLIELVGQRRIAATEALVKALDHSDSLVRSAALTSLGNTVAANNLSVLVSQVVAPKHPEDSSVAEQALKAAAIRMPDREACASELGAALGRSSIPTQSVLLEILGAVGGTRALQSVGAAAKSTDLQLQDVGSRLLGEWMTIDAAPVLLDLVKNAPNEKYQIRALSGYIRIARQFVMPDSERVEMCQNALDASRQSGEQKRVLDILKRYPSTGMLKLAVTAMKKPDLKEEATQAAMAISQKLDRNNAEVQELLSKAGLDKVK